MLNLPDDLHAGELWLAIDPEFRDRVALWQVRGDGKLALVFIRDDGDTDLVYARADDDHEHYVAPASELRSQRRQSDWTLVL